MRRWECVVCGLIYDEKEGWPDDGIAPGTRWEDVPDDWQCPDCGVGKDDFVLIEEAAPVEEDFHHETAVEEPAAPVIIVGTGLAGYGLAREFRKHDSDTPLILITSDDGRSYSKPNLSTGFTRNQEAAQLAQFDAGSMGRMLKASVWTMTQVSDIDTRAQTLRVGDSKTHVHYAKLILATGAEVIQPPLSGDGLEQVYAVNDLMDYDDFRAALKSHQAHKICIIGAGLIGCEFTNDLLNGGYEIEVVDALGGCLPTLLPEPAGRAVQRALEAAGARFHFGALVKEVAKAGDGVRVVLDSGQVIDADMVVSAVGVRPRLGLAREAGLEVQRGIVTNRELQTSASNVYALGDCAEVEGHALVYVAPLMAAARALGKTLAGEPTEVVYPAMPVVVKTPACPIVVAPPAPGAEGEWRITEDGNNVRAEFLSPTGDLLGFALTGEAIKDKMALQKLLPPILE